MSTVKGIAETLLALALFVAFVVGVMAGTGALLGVFIGAVRAVSGI